MGVGLPLHMKFDHIVVKKRDTFVEDSVNVFMTESKEKCTNQKIVPWQPMVVPIERLNIENENNVVLIRMKKNII